MVEALLDRPEIKKEMLDIEGLGIKYPVVCPLWKIYELQVAVTNHRIESVLPALEIEPWINIQINKLTEAGNLRPFICKCYPFDYRNRQELPYFEVMRDNNGKLVLDKAVQ